MEAKTISHGAGKQVLAKLVAEGETRRRSSSSEGLAQISDASELEAIVDRAIEAEPEAAEQVRQGNEKAIGRIVGAVMKETQGPGRRRRRHEADQGASLGDRWPALPMLIIALLFGLATGIMGRGQGQLLLHLVRWSAPCCPIFGLIAVILYRSEHEEPERRCPTCNKILKLHVQVCPRCGTDLYLPDPSEVRPGTHLQMTGCAFAHPRTT